MTSRAWFSTMAAALFTACASQPDAPPVAEAAQSALPAVQTEAEAAQQLEKKFQEAAKGYKVVERDGRTLYCKREKLLGSTIPTLQCMTEPQLRLQVENMEELRGRMRNSAKCTMGRSGGGGGACGGS
jgi:hypothetical protein